MGLNNMHVAELDAAGEGITIQAHTYAIQPYMALQLFS
jgi:hypothetical protein